eukprot:gene14781-20831_t
MNTNVYQQLENFIDSTALMPPELQRIMQTIKALDEKCIEITDAIQQGVTQLLGMPPKHLQTEGPSEEYLVLSKRVESGQKMLQQFALEKVQLAQQAYDLMELHAIELDKQIDEFESDLRAQGLLEAPSDSYMQGFNIELPAPVGPPPPGLPSSVPPRIKVPKTEPVDWSIGTPADTPVQPMLPSLKRAMTTKSHKRLREDIGAQPQTVALTPSSAPLESASKPFVGGSNSGGMGMGLQKRRVSNPVHMPLLSPMPGTEDGVFPLQPPMMEIGGPESVQHAFTPQTPAADVMPAPQFIGFRSQPPLGFRESASKPQSPKPHKYLYLKDISSGLRGRHAELFWPDDKLWYLIEIQEVILQTARIMYTTGEVEELELEEIARDNHMVVIPLECYNNNQIAM